jgi:predicted metal-dependent hydrolase
MMHGAFGWRSSNKELDLKKKGGRAVSRVIRIEGVGDVLFERSRKARHICLSIKPYRGVRVAVPVGIPFEQAEAVATAKVDWIIKHLRRMADAERCAGRPERMAPINRTVARRVLVDRLAELAGRHGFEYNRVYVRNQKTRWGSCSAQNNINLNVNLIRLPEALRDYVILHELVHTRIKNHGPRFWEELDTYVADCRQVDKQLNRYDYMLAAP